MASIGGKEKAAGKGKLSKRCLTLDEKIKMLDVVEKRKMSCRDIAEEFKIEKNTTSQ